MQNGEQNRIAQARILAVFLFLCIGIGGIVAYAQNGEPETESGSLQDTIDALQKQRLEEEWQTRIARSQEFLQNLADVRGAAAAFRRAVAQHRERRSEHRATCATDLRSASKYTKFPIALRCYRTDLALNADLLRKERAYLEQMAGVSESTRALALTRTDMLADSISALMTGIDSDVFEILDDLVESKQNLLRNYRIPQWLAVNQMKAQQLATWIDSLVTRVALLTENEQETLDAATMELLLEGITCLNEAQQILAQVADMQEYEQARTQLRTAEERIQACLAPLRETGGTMQAEEQTAPEQIVQPEISRKLRSRLDEHFRIGNQ
ncbi:MAG: hypothetical protein PHU04_02310 [Candidatus Peribacteraceae bacterium]|nr:hypothetical protein [Candidatus Peribacteraceae bacterium]